MLRRAAPYFLHTDGMTKTHDTAKATIFRLVMHIEITASTLEPATAPGSFRENVLPSDLLPGRVIQAICCNLDARLLVHDGRRWIGKKGRSKTRMKTISSRLASKSLQKRSLVPSGHPGTYVLDAKRLLRQISCSWIRTRRFCWIEGYYNCI